MADFIPFTDYVDHFIKLGSDGKPFILQRHQRIIFDLADELFADDLWNQFLYSAIKKSGKTELNALKCLHWAQEHDDDELIIQANDYDQSVGRVFTAMAKLCKYNKIACKVLADTIAFPNGSVVKAIASDFAGEAGAQQGFHSVDEPWAVVQESALRLLEELTPLINKPSIRFISTYSGWINQSKWLWDLFVQGVDSSVHPEGKAERIHDELPIFLNRDASLFSYWDSGEAARRMPWQIGPKADRYYAQQKRTMRAGAYARLHLNEWGSGEDVFITPELWDSCVDANHRPIVRTRDATWWGVDAAPKGDTNAIVGVKWLDDTRLALVAHRIWKPTPGEPLDFEATIEKYLRDVYALYGDVQKIVADPYQLHRSIMTLQVDGIPIEEFPQTVPNCTLMGQTLFDLLNGKNLVLYNAPDMREQALNTIAIETPRGFRIAKEKASKKIDSIVALAMACVAAMSGDAGHGSMNDLEVGGRVLPIGASQGSSIDNDFDEAIEAASEGDSEFDFGVSSGRRGDFDW